MNRTKLEVGKVEPGRDFVARDFGERRKREERINGQTRGREKCAAIFAMFATLAKLPGDFERCAECRPRRLCIVGGERNQESEVRLVEGAERRIMWMAIRKCARQVSMWRAWKEFAGNLRVFRMLSCPCGDNVGRRALEQIANSKSPMTNKVQATNYKQDDGAEVSRCGAGLQSCARAGRDWR